jgi:hypothetical protein
MQINELNEILKSPSVKLLTSGRSQLFNISFFISAFDDNSNLSEERILNKLSDYIELSQPESDDEYEIKPFDSYLDKAKKYVKKWIENGFLTILDGERGEYFYELSVFTEKTIQWFNTLKKKEFVGTESKFKNIFQQLQELVEYTNEDKEKRLQDLKKRKLEIEKQIQDMEMGENLFVFDEYQIKSRLYDLNQSAKELSSDFKEVEENFKTITQEIHKKHSSSEYSKGNILQFTFDAIEQLKQSEQGKSFYAFWEFLLTQSKQNQWNDLILLLYKTIEEREISYSDDFLKRLKPQLHKLGYKVYVANEKMGEKLSRIIGERENEERQKIKTLIKEIKTSILKTNESNKIPDISLIIEDNFDINLPIERNFSLTKNESTVFTNKPQNSNYSPQESDTLQKIYNQVLIDKKELTLKIRTILKDENQISIDKIIELNGSITKGLAEVFAYLSVLKDFRTTINKELTCQIMFDKIQNKIIETPYIIVTK